MKPDCSCATYGGTVRRSAPPTQIDYSDYRDVAGVKMPHKIVITWTDGQNTIALNQIQPNVAIDAARFATPKPFARK